VIASIPDSLSVLLISISPLVAADLPAIAFPEVEGWARNTRYDPPSVPATSIAYTTKAKVGGDYIRAQVQVPNADGKSLKEALPAFEAKILKNPIHKNMKKTRTTEVEVFKAKVSKVTFSSQFSGTPTETVLYAFKYGEYFILLEHAGPAADSAKRATVAMNLVKALVEAAQK